MAPCKNGGGQECRALPKRMHWGYSGKPRLSLSPRTAYFQRRAKTEQAKQELQTALRLRAPLKVQTKRGKRWTPSRPRRPISTQNYDATTQMLACTGVRLSRNEM